VGDTFGRVAWTMDDLYKNLKMHRVGIDIKNRMFKLFSVPVATIQFEGLLVANFSWV